MERFFNTAGPVDPEIHYVVPPLSRIDLPEVLRLIDQRKYFVLHAPRQTGKTSCLLALMDHLNRGGRFLCLYANAEPGQAFREDLVAGVGAVAAGVARGARDLLGDDEAVPLFERIAGESQPGLLLEEFLTRYAKVKERPVVLLLDEIDSLVGDTLISVLRQIRSGYAKRPAAFPQSIVLCGVRDVRDYRLRTDEGKAVVTGGSAFNVKAESLRLGSFTRSEVAALYAEHTAATGQPFAEAAVERAWELTLGQPWLVNALAYEACFRGPEARDRSRAVTKARIDEAQESLIVRKDTHLDNLAERLREARVRSVIEPILAGTTLGDTPDDDRQYVVDLGLARREGGGGLVIANPIYREVLPRALAQGPQDSLPSIQPSWLDHEGKLVETRLLEAFLAFWRRHGQPLMASAPYHEIAPHLVLMAFLHRVVNGGGTLEREYAIGSGRMDLCLRYGEAVLGIELKVWRDGGSDPVAEGLEQLDGYLSGLCLPTGWLVVFDRRSNQPAIAERTSVSAAATPAGRSVAVVRA